MSLIISNCHVPQGQMKIFDPTASINASTFFSINQYTGNGSSLKISNNLDMATNGGMMWSAALDGGTYGVQTIDTERGGSEILGWYQNSHLTQSAITSFDTDGCTLGNSAAINTAGVNYTSWNFIKAPGFLDIVTYTGDGVAGRQIPHNLGVTPSLILIQGPGQFDSTYGQWFKLNDGLYAGKFSSIGQWNSSSAYWNSTPMDANNITLGGFEQVNGINDEFTMYLFGDSAHEYMAADSYVGNGLANNTVNLGWQPQYVMTLGGSATAPPYIYIHDKDRSEHIGLHFGSPPSNPGTLTITPTGFTVNGNGFNNGAHDYGYIAIRDTVN